ncbi:hypothetical protein C8Q75DRAFT_808871 [Abortiporus biennis]|nr:hypothetical protein C8Q75DRAFT_808871 [Abortiporus biennis]
MSETYSQFYPATQQFNEPIYLSKADDGYGYDDSSLNSKQQSFDFLQYSQLSADVLAPHPEQFESEIDSLAAFGAELDNLPAVVETSDFFTYVRSDTPTRGVPSTFTVSSESASAYDSGYGDSFSSYNYPTHSPSSHYSAGSFVTSEEIDMDFKRLGLLPADNTSTYSPPSEHSSPSSLSMSSVSPVVLSRGSFSDYEPINQIRVGSSSASDYYPQSYPTVAVQQATVSPANVSAPLPVASQVPRAPRSESSLTSDPKKKYACPNCSRSFARQFNLKTHIQTHNPNRAKPFICSQKSCGRAFSRKHDLQRHIVSIHRAEPGNGSSSSASSVGVGGGSRSRCEKCGRSWSSKGKEAGCDCDDAK